MNLIVWDFPVRCSGVEVLSRYLSLYLNRSFADFQPALFHYKVVNFCPFILHPEPPTFFSVKIEAEKTFKQQCWSNMNHKHQFQIYLSLFYCKDSQVLSKGHRSAVKYFFKYSTPVLIMNVLTC